MGGAIHKSLVPVNTSIEGVVLMNNGQKNGLNFNRLNKL
jgi:hypothetical protein